MNLNTTYDFKESTLGPNFAKEKMVDFKNLINLGQSFTVISMPGVGVSYFLKYLVCQDNLAHFIHVDLYSLPTFSRLEFYKLLHKELGGKTHQKSEDLIFQDCKKALQNLSANQDKIVIVFSRFDQLKKELTHDFLSNLQSLTTLADKKVVLIFTAIQPLYELAPEAVTGGNLPFYSKILYFKPYSEDDLKALFFLEHNSKFHPNLKELIEPTGGHNQLFRIILNSQNPQNLLLDKFIKLQLRDLINYLDYQQKKDVQKIALGKTISEVDDYLIKVGYVLKSEKGYHLFSSLLKEYIKTNLPVRLPAKEKVLFTLLKKNLGKVVSKDEIFKEVWGENSEDATDWALDALIYRLRKHPFLHSHGYIIESQKKIGYILIQG